MFRVLSLDGGGIKGAFAASVLATLEEDTGLRVSDHFDLIAGTSTGGIIAIGLGLGLPARDIARFYKEQGPAIFPGTSMAQRVGGRIRQFFKPKHSHADLRVALQGVLGERRFGDSNCRLVIPTYDAIGGRIFVMKTAHHERFRYDIDASAVDVAMATSAAPTYFAAASFPRHANASYVDGGVWANCPVMVGLTEAVAFLGQRLEDIDMLSIGATQTPFSIANHTDSGIAKWNAGLVDLMFDGQAESALAQARLLLGGRLHRINANVQAGEFTLDDARPQRIEQLLSLGRAHAAKAENANAVKARFLNGVKADAFKPVLAPARVTASGA